MGQAFKFGDPVDESQLDGSCRSIALLADDDLCNTWFLASFLGVVLVTVDEHDDVSILLNRPRLAEVAHHRSLVSS